MKELAIDKLELLIKDLKDMQKLEKDTGKQYFTLQLFAIRVNEIYKILVNKALGDKENEET